MQFEVKTLATLSHYSNQRYARVRQMSRFVMLQVHATVLAAAFSSSALSQGSAAPSARPPVLEVRLASSSPVLGYQLMPTASGAFVDSVVYLAPASVISDVDVARARTKPAADGLVVEILLSDVAATRLRETTGNSIGQHLAVLANGELAAKSIIMSAIPRGNRLTLGLLLAPDGADSVRARIAARWPATAP